MQETWEDLQKRIKKLEDELQKCREKTTSEAVESDELSDETSESETVPETSSTETSDIEET